MKTDGMRIYYERIEKKTYHERTVKDLTTRMQQSTILMDWFASLHKCVIFLQTH